MSMWNISKQDVRRALAECKDVGELDFLEQYGFKPARSFLLVHRGRYFQSKAIVGVAHKFSNGRALKNHQFSGGTKHSAAVLRGLGFEVVERPVDDWMLWPRLDEDAKLLKGHFPKWKRWSKRDEFVEELVWPGVYVIGRFNAPPARVFPLPRDVVYVGQTTRTLRERLHEFDKSAVGGNGHSGGCSFYGRYAGRLSNVWVSVLPVRLPPGEQPGAITVLEGLLIWSYARRWGRPPVCNLK